MITFVYKAACLSLSCLLVVGAFADTTTDEFIPSSVQREGDALAGKHALLNKPIVSCGIPLNAFKQMAQLQSYKTAPITLKRDSDIASSLPFNMNLVNNSSGVQLVASNCLSCHGAPLFGELVIGLGNEFADFTQNPSLLVERAGAWVVGDQETKAWEKFADRINAIAPFMQMRTAGVNPANNLTFALMAHRDAQTNQWSETALSKLPSTFPPPVSVPPWWRMKKKNALFSMGEGRGDHARIMMSAAILCTDSLEELAQLDALAVDIAAYIKSLAAPKYPFNIDKPLASHGEKVFNNTCARCHGRYGHSDSSYPNRLVPIDVIGTDSALIEFAFADGQVYVDWFKQSYFGQMAQAQPAKGYVAPPLDGIWSTAPYLHNGSVPSIALLLDSARRPLIWRHSEPSSSETSRYNQKELGWHYVAMPTSSDNAQLGGDFLDKWIYDTRVYGYGNRGHRFGDGLSQTDRIAVIEYLKTL